MRSWVGFSSLDLELGIGNRWGRMVVLGKCGVRERGAGQAFTSRLDGVVSHGRGQSGEYCLNARISSGPCPRFAKVAQNAFR